MGFANVPISQLTNKYCARHCMVTTNIRAAFTLTVYADAYYGVRYAIIDTTTRT